MTPRRTPSCQSPSTASSSAAPGGPTPSDPAIPVSTSGREMSRPFSKSAVAEREAHRLAGRAVPAIAGVCEGEGRQRRRGEVPRVEAAEEMRGDLGPQFSNMRGRDVRVERCPVDQLERPCPNVQEHVFPAALRTTRRDTVESHVREGTPDVCVDLQDGHAPSLRSRDRAVPACGPVRCSGPARRVRRSSRRSRGRSGSGRAAAADSPRPVVAGGASPWGPCGARTGRRTGDGRCN